MPSTTNSSVRGLPGVPEFLFDANEHRRQIARKLNALNQGKFNCTVDVTLNASTGATVIADNRIGFNSAVTPLMAFTLAGAVAIATGMWFDAPMGQVQATTATIVVHHNISAAAARIRFGIFG